MSMEQAAQEALKLRGKAIGEYAKEFNRKADKRTGALTGLRSKFVNLDIALDGLQNGMTFIAGRPHHAKTMKMLNWAFSISEHNKQKHVMFFSIDDDENKISARLMGMHSGFSMMHLKHPNRFLESPEVPEGAKNDFRVKRQRAEDFLCTVTNFELRLSSQGRKLSDIISICNQRISEGKEIVVFIDNFHNLRYEGSQTSENKQWIEVSENLKDYVKSNDFPCVCTVKLRKESGDFKGAYRRPCIDEIKNAVDLQYDADVIISIYSHYIASGKNSDLVKTSKYSKMKNPIIETCILKNKEGDCYVYTYDILYGYKAWMEEMDSATFEDHKKYIDTWKEQKN